MSEMMTEAPYLSDDEITQICEPLVQSAAQIRYLKTLGWHVERRPNGRPLVARAEFLRAMVSGKPESPRHASPNREALMHLVQKGKRGNGPQAQK